MSDPRRAAAAVAGPRRPHWVRIAGWAVGIAAWAICSDGRVLLAAASLAVALLLRVGYVVLATSGGRATFWSAWFFYVAAAAELAWLIARSA